MGRRSVDYLSGCLWRLRKQLEVDFVVANGENATEIHGLSAKDAQAILDTGVDLITLGNHTYGCRDIIRPANYPALCPGMGYTVREVQGVRLLCINLSGTAFLDELNNPFTVIDHLLEDQKGRYDLALVDFHAEATSEKMAMGLYLDGRVQIVFGTHTHVTTADETVLPGGTRYITDLGMTGPVGSVLGTDAHAVLHRMRTRMPTRFSVADSPVEGHAALFFLEDGRPFRCTNVEQVVF